MNGVWIAVAGFIGASLGSILTGAVVERYRQRNRLRLAAIDKRLEAYQTGCRWIFKIGGRLLTIQDLEKSMSEEETQTLRNELQEMRYNAMRWVQNHYLYLGRKISLTLMRAFENGDAEQVMATREVIDREAGLPSLNADWPLFGLMKNQK